MKLEDYIKDCLKDQEFKKYWLEDGLPLIESKVETFNTAYTELSELFESEEEYKNKTAELLKNKGIKSPYAKMTVEFYETGSDCPVEEFIENIQDQKLKEKTVKNIYNLSELGLDVNKTNNSSYVEDGIYELRTIQGNNITRIFYFFVIGNKIILTNGYIKKSNKWDKTELKKAKKYRDEYSTRGV